MDPPACLYSDKWNMPWDVPEHRGQLAHRAALEWGACWKRSWDIIIPEPCLGIVWASAAWHRPEVCQEMFKSLGVKMIMYTPHHSISKRKAFHLPQGGSIFLW